jgi:hypothetical protein
MNRSPWACPRVCDDLDKFSLNGNFKVYVKSCG